MSDSQKPPGWYPDPTMAGTQRYWDGAKWTDHVAPLKPQAPSVSSETVAAGVMKAVFILVVLSLVIAVTFGILADDSGATDQDVCDSLHSLSPEATC